MASRTLKLVAVAAAVAWALPVFAMFVEPLKDCPVQRLLDNYSRYSLQRPEDGHNQYVLARLQCLASRDPDAMLECGIAARMESAPHAGSAPASDALVEACDKSLLEERPARLCNEELDHLLKRLIRPKATRWEDYERLQHRGDAEAGAALGQLATAGASIVLRATDRVARLQASDDERNQMTESLQRLDKAFTKARLLREAVRNYGRAMADPTLRGVCRMGRAWAYESLGDAERAFEDYKAAFRESAELEIAQGDRRTIAGIWHGSIALEAGRRILLSSTLGS